LIKKASALLGIVAVVGVVAAGIVGLLRPTTVDATQHNATRSFSVDTVAAGGELDVTIVISGHGGLASIVEELPAGFTYQRASPINPTVDGQILTFTLFGAEDEVTYTVRAPEAAGGPHTFSGVVGDAFKDERNVGGADRVTVEAEATILPDPGNGNGGGTGPSPTASASRSFSSASVAADGQMTVTIAVANYGGIGEIKDTLPEGFAYVSSQPAGGIFEQSSRTVTFPLVADTSFSYTVTAPSTGGTGSFRGFLRDSAKVDHQIGGLPSPTTAVLGR
jgi:hypothetical protein